MKFILLIFIVLSNVAPCIGQVSLNAISLENGKYEVGFWHYIVMDSTRTYKRIFDWNNKEIPRQIPISIWYPSKVDSNMSSRMIVQNYMEILKMEEEWENLPNDQILNWFYSNTPENREHLREKTSAYLKATPIASKFPAVIYTPGYEASSIENFALCEMLASHGYVVIASPSRGTENRFLEGASAKDLETQARDIEFLIQELNKFPNIDHNRVACVGFSFGGLSNILAQMRNDRIRAVVSLDGSIKYQYGTLKKSPFASIQKMDVPFIHMAQKDIPKKVLEEDKIDSTLNYEFEFFDLLTNSHAYSLKFHNLTHSYFSTLGVLFQTRDKRQDKSDLEIMESYKWMSIYALNFLNGFLKDDIDSSTYLDREPVANGIPAGVVSISSKSPKERLYSFEDFNKQAASQKYHNLYSLYESIRFQDPSIQLPEGKLNNLGLQLVFNPNTSDKGISVLQFAIDIYSKSSNLFDSLAEAFLFVGDKEMAIKNFEKSLKLNAQNQNAINRLQELKQ